MMRRRENMKRKSQNPWKAVDIEAVSATVAFLGASFADAAQNTLVSFGLGLLAVAGAVVFVKNWDTFIDTVFGH